MEININKVLENLNSEYQQITDLVPNLYYFSDKGENDISEGGGDMYDNGNEFYTNLVPVGGEDSSSIPYTHTQVSSGGEENYEGIYTNPPMDGAIVSGSGYFGNESQYFTNMYPGMFVLAATNCDITGFYVDGGLGADGSGSITTDTFEFSRNGYNFTVFFKGVGDAGDPSVNHIIILPQESTGITRSITEEGGEENNTDADADYVDIVDGTLKNVFFLLVSSAVDGGESNAEGVAISSEEALAIAYKFIDLLDFSPQHDYGTAHYPSPTINFEVIAYSEKNIISFSLPENLESTIASLKTRTILIYKRGAFKHGDKFTAHGREAVYLKKRYVDVDDPSLKII